MKKNLICNLLYLGSITACTTLNSEYDCPVASGKQCQSLRKVDAALMNQHTEKYRTGKYRLVKLFDPQHRSYHFLIRDHDDKNT